MNKETKVAMKEEKETSNLHTPMWQISRLARHHELKPVYSLEKEDPKKQKKRFTMSLTLDKEVWTGYGNTKKQAKQNAANKALKGTELSFPLLSKKTTVNTNALTATVRLNGWAMVNRKKVTYTLCEKKYLPTTNNYNVHQQQLVAMSIPYYRYCPEKTFLFSPSDYAVTNSSDTYSVRQYRAPVKKPSYFRVSVEVDDEKFFGEGGTQQAARHDAAKNALDTLIINSQAEVSAVSPEKSKKSPSAIHKSPVCLLNEEVLARNMSLVVSILEEKGPPHLKCYTVEVTAGHFVGQKLDEKRIHFKTVASGTSKKAAKQAAASQILKGIKEQLPPREKSVPRIEKGPLKGHQPPTNVLHPVSRLMQICQAQKSKAPAYEEIAGSTEKHAENNFTMKCSVEDKSVIAGGRNKKDAKRAAAESMLAEISKQLNLQVVPNKDMLPQKSSLKAKEITADTAKRLQVKFKDDGNETSR